MSRRGSRGSAGTLRRLTPVLARKRGRPAARYLIRSGTNYLAGINSDRTAIVSPDPREALCFPREVAGTVAMEMRDRGWDAELVPVTALNPWRR